MITVTVLLAVYNGEKYLEQQISSLLNQSFRDIKIIIRDDGSTDSSQDIIDSFCEKYPEIISCIKGNPTGSAKLNFSKLLEHCDDDYIMFCDQDDIWLPKKIETTLAAMKAVENGGETPVLVHTDLSVVDQELNVISRSFFDFQQLKQEKLNLPRLLVQNYVTGCTVMLNRALVKKCGKVPENCIMHDWWLALTAVLFGEIVCVSEPTILYRQHADNQVGAKASYGFAFIKRKLSTLKEVRKNYNETYIQAKALLDCYGDVLTEQQKNLIKTYCKIPGMCKFKRIRTLQKFGFKKCTKLRVIGQYVLT